MKKFFFLMLFCVSAVAQANTSVCAKIMKMRLDDAVQNYNDGILSQDAFNITVMIAISSYDHCIKDTQK